MMASAIKNVSMTYVPRDMSLLCLFLSRRGCSKLLTIDNKCRGLILSPFPARSQEQHGRGDAPSGCRRTLDQLLSIHPLRPRSTSADHGGGGKRRGEGMDDERS
jgi:hypothetical protein